MSEQNNTSSSGIGILGLLGIAFVVLKLAHVIDWSWWYVTLPFWGGLALFVIIMTGIAAVLIVRSFLGGVRSAPRK